MQIPSVNPVDSSSSVQVRTNYLNRFVNYCSSLYVPDFLQKENAKSPIVPESTLYIHAAVLDPDWSYVITALCNARFRLPSHQKRRLPVTILISGLNSAAYMLDPPRFTFGVGDSLPLCWRALSGWDFLLREHPLADIA